MWINCTTNCTLLPSIRSCCPLGKYSLVAVSPYRQITTNFYHNLTSSAVPSTSCSWTMYANSWMIWNDEKSDLGAWKLKVGLQTRSEQQGTEQKPKRTYRQQWHNFIADSLLLMSVYRSSHALIFVTDWTGWSAIEPCIQFAGLASKRRVTVMGVLVFLLLFTYGNYDNLSFPCWISSRPRNGNCTE